MPPFPPIIYYALIIGFILLPSFSHNPVRFYYCYKKLIYSSPVYYRHTIFYGFAGFTGIIHLSLGSGSIWDLLPYSSIIDFIALGRMVA